MKEQFEKLAATGKITATQVTSLLSLTEAGFCSHRSWGVGKISQVDTLQWRIVIDFESKSAHSMDVGFAADTLRPIRPVTFWRENSVSLRCCGSWPKKTRWS
jgi:transcription elongation factor GreA-like protein